MPAKKYTQAQREEALNLYHTHGPTAVEKQLGILKGTVTRWAKETGIETVSVSATRAGTEAASVYAKARRVELAQLLLEDAHRLRAQLWLPARLVSFGGKDNTLAETTLDEPLFVDKKNIISAVSTAMATVSKIDFTDAAPDTSGESVVDKLMAGFVQAYEAGK